MISRSTSQHARLAEGIQPLTLHQLARCSPQPFRMDLAEGSFCGRIALQSSSPNVHPCLPGGQPVNMHQRNPPPALGSRGVWQPKGHLVHVSPPGLTPVSLELANVSPATPWPPRHLNAHRSLPVPQLRACTSSTEFKSTESPTLKYSGSSKLGQQKRHPRRPNLCMPMHAAMAHAHGIKYFKAVYVAQNPGNIPIPGTRP